MVKRVKAERTLAEADRLAAQWFNAAPCPQHGSADLTLGIPNGSDFYQSSTTMDEIVPREEICATPVAVICRQCGRLTGTFVNDPEKLWSHQRLRTAFLSMTE